MEHVNQLTQNHPGLNSDLKFEIKYAHALKYSKENFVFFSGSLYLKHNYLP